MPPGRSACGPGRGCRPRTRPSSAPILRRSRSSSRAQWRQSASWVPSVGSARKPWSATPEVRCRLERRQAERVHEHQLAEPVAVVAGEAGRDGPAQRVAHENGRRWTGVFDQLAQPRQHAIGVERAVAHLRAALAGQVGDHQGIACPPDLRSPSPSGRRVHPGREGAPSADPRPPPARRSTRRPAAAVAR